MLKVKELKKRGKEAFYRNWKSCIILCFIFTVLVGGTIVNTTRNLNNPRDEIKIINQIKLQGETNSDIVNELITSISSKEEKNNIIIKNTRGVIGSIANNVSKSGSFLFGILNAINQALFKDRIWASIIIIIGAILSFIYWAFISKVLEIGQARFFLENQKYTKTKASKILLPYKQNKFFHIGIVMLVKNILNLLWCFTIIGGIIKYYAYRLVPYILAENPNMKTKDVLKLSQDMMKNHKWELFLLDLSFIGWSLLGVITFNISNIVFTNPYFRATNAEVYMKLRQGAKEKNIKNADLLNDNYLEGKVLLDEYPEYEYMLKKGKERKWLNLNYKRSYSFLDLVLLFFFLSCFGWIWEVLLHLFQYGSFVNRGTIHGPWLPIYGAGGVLILVLLKKYRKNPFLYFTLTMVVCGIVEYSTSVYLEYVHHMVWWDYEGYFLNLNSRICLEGLLLFGIAGIAVTYIIAPLFANITAKIKKETKVIIAVILVIIIAADFVYSSKYPNQGEGISKKYCSVLIDNDRLGEMKRYKTLI